MGYASNELIPMQISSLISYKEKLFPALKRVDLGWHKIQYPNKSPPSERFVHPGFEKKDAEKLLLDFEVAGVEMVIGRRSSHERV